MALPIKKTQELVGNTPLARLSEMEKDAGIQAALYAKLEYLNPAGSVKDRAAKEMIQEAERSGKLQPGGTIVEPTSGNTGIGLAYIGVPKGYRVILTMPETMSEERRAMLKAYGAELVLTEGTKGMKGAIEKAKQIANKANAFVPSQFDNPANPAAHEKTTGPEIWHDLDGKVDLFVAGVGSGGTVSGVGRFLKQKKKEVQIVAVQPQESPVLTGGAPGAHKIQGIGAGFIPGNYDATVVDEVVDVPSEEAMKTAKDLCRREGLLCGISSGAALWAGLQLAARPENSQKNIVILLPDSGDRYLTLGIY
ncbi:cysteine synthase A [Ruminococcaceae bacterium OttesenSCG-928-I18]|nr:cysteine synthase A [Ruminococcaceae bacterium OttesenSCG-928-I18]